MWLPVLLLAVMASSSACPQTCQCRSPIIECRTRFPSSNELDKLPAGNYTELRLQAIDDENFFVNPNKTFAMFRPRRFFSKLETISLANCSVRLGQFRLKDVRYVSLLKVLLEELRQMPNLVSFNVSRNNFTDGLDLRAVAQGKDKLKVLELKNNNKLDGMKFLKIDIPTLVRLDLSNNCLRHIDPAAIDQLANLTYLDLSDNSLTFISDNTFGKFRNLQKLNLAGNRLYNLKSEWFQNLSSLIELDISRNRLHFIPADILQPLKNLSVLKLSENLMIERDLSLLLDSGRRLETVDASRTGLARVPATLTHSIRELKLAGNQLTSIDSGDFDSYLLLRLLDLSTNKLIVIEDDALGRLDFLEELVLYRNLLPTVPKSLPSGLKNLDLSQNSIMSLKANDLQGLGQLLELNLSGNVISSIEGGSFRQLTALKKLDLSDNPIKRLPSDTLSGPSKLAVLRMSGLMYLETEANQNQDTAFPYPTPERLKSLDVSRSPALAAQLLADNAALSACKNLRELDLSYTNISAIRSDFPYVLPQLQKLILTGNSWNCSIDQFWLCEWMTVHGASIEFSTRCTTPFDLEGILLEEVPGLSNLTTTQKYSRVRTTAYSVTSTTAIPSVTTTAATSTVDTMASWQRIVTYYRNITKEISATTAIPTTEAPCLYSTQDSNAESSKLESSNLTENDTVAMTTVGTKQAVSTTVEQKSPEPSMVSGTKVSTQESVNYESTKLPVPTTTQMYIVKSSWSDDIIPTTVSIENSTPPRNNKRKRNKLRSTVSPRSQYSKRTNKLRTTTLSSPDNQINTEEPIIRPEHTATMDIDAIIRSQHKALKDTIPIPDKKSYSSRTFSDFSHSKLLLANEEPVQVSGFAEELNDAGKVTGSESVTSGAHPGMLVLLGAAIGAAAALTIVLSRRATVRHREQQQYQRHENIEVHALTPTTELW